MRSYLTQLILTCISTIALYILIQMANLAVYRPTAEMITVVVQATVAAQPTPTPIILAIPVTVEVTRLVAQPLATEVAVVQTPQPPPTQTPVPLLHLPAIEASVAADIASNVAARSDVPAITVAEPVVQAAAVGCNAPSGGSYTLIPMEAADTNHPDSQHGDLNLALRGYQPSSAAKEFVTYSGAVDAGAPQLAGLFADQRRPTITNVYQVRDWQWACEAHGCATDWLTNYEVTLLGMATAPGEALFFPKREAEIYGGGYVAVVLYAEERRLTIGYTRDGTVANGYAVHLENLCVDPTLLAQYQAGNASGRQQLPGLHNGDTVGTAASGEILVAIRDRGTFMDPRAEHDWWH